MKKYTIEYYPTEQDINEMLLLDKSAFDLKDNINLNVAKQWLAQNNEIYTVLKLDGIVVGYMNFTSITKDCYDKFYLGKYKDYLIKKDEIIPFHKGDNYCMLLSIVIRKDLRDTNAIVELWKGFIKRIKTFKKQGINICSVISDCVSIDGIKFFLTNFEAKYICNSKDWGKIYEGRILFKDRVKMPKVRLVAIDSKNIKLAAKIQYNIFRDSNSVGYADYLEEVNNNNIVGNDWCKDFIIYHKNIPVGVIGLFKYGKYPENIWLNWFGVLPEYRVKGYGTAALFKIIKLARMYNANNFRLFTYALWYKDAQNIYRKTMQLEEDYTNENDIEYLKKQGECKIFSISLVDKVAKAWNNKFINVTSEKQLNDISIEKLKLDKIIN